MKVFVLDVDYELENENPIIRIWGKSERNENVLVLFEGFYPYFYAMPKEGKEETLLKR